MMLLKKLHKYQTRYLKNTWPAVLQSHQWCKMHVVVTKHNWVPVAFFSWPKERQVNTTNIQRSKT